jgi:flagellar biosynthesis protein FlhF
VDALVRSGLSQDLATRFARIASRDLGPRPNPVGLAAATEKGMAALLPFTATPLKSRVLFVVGPPGSGKTTTAAKLAARVIHAAGRPVIFAEADTERIGALEQASVFSDHIGVRLAPIEKPSDLSRAVRYGGERSCIVVDTAGVGSADETRLRALSELRRGVADSDMVVLLPAGMHHAEAGRLLSRFEPLAPTCVAFSRVDDGGRLGDLVTALAATELPLAFVTNGHRVPHDLEDASPRGLAALILRSGLGPEPPMEAAR